MKRKTSFSLLAALMGLSLGALAGCGGQPQSSASSAASSPSSSATSQSTESSHSHSSESDHSSHSHSDSSHSESSHSHSESSESSQSSIPHVHEWGEPTWEWTKIQDGYSAKATFVCTLDPTHIDVHDAVVTLDHTTNPTCTVAGEAVYVASVTHAGQQFSQTRTDTLAPTDHNFPADVWEHDETDHWHVCANPGCQAISGKAAHTFDTRTVTVDPTCEEEGATVKVTFCTVCGFVSETETTKINKLDHNYVLDEEASVAAKCLEPGKKVYKCTLCGDSYEQVLSALGHDWVAGEKCTDNYHCSRCEATKPGTEHDYQLDEVNSHKATCTEDGVEKYVCSKCQDSYEITKEATGHAFAEGSEWELDRVEADTETKCLYHYIEKRFCVNCKQYVERTESKTSHTYIAKITKEATCQEKGQKQYVCKVCGAVEEPEEIAVNPNAHNWDEGTTVGNITTFKCKNEGCTATKTSVVAEDKKIEVAAEDFKAVEEVQLSNAAMAFDESAKELLDGKELAIEVGETTVADLPEEIEVDKEQLNVTDNTKVYDFSIIDKATEQPAAFSGEGSGKVTVRLPYELQEGDDADALVIYYVSEGKVQEFDAKYENGYAVFETDHFSYYLVTYRTPAQVCEKLGHKWGEHGEVKATCLSDGYTYRVCDRCGGREILERTAAKGHQWANDTEGAKEPTCTEPGYGGKVCSVCGEHYGGSIPPLGHHFEQESVVAPTCTEPGKVTYVCEHDETHTYTTDIPAKGHNYQAVTTKATCQAEGKVEYICSECGDKDESRTIVLPKIEHNYVLAEETEEAYIYKCSYCEDTYTVSKNAAPLTKEYVVEHSFFTNSSKSIAGTDFTIVIDDLEFKVTIRGEEMSGTVSAAEAHIGSNAAKQLEAYASAKFDLNVGQQMAGEAVAYVVGNKVYLKTSMGQDQYMVYDLAALAGNAPVDEILDLFPEILAFVEAEVVPFIDTIVEANKQWLNETAFNLADALLAFKSTPTGYELAFDYDKILTLAELAKTGSIEDVIDALLGQGTVASLLNNLEQYVTLSLYDALAKLKTDIGFDYKELLKIVDKGVAAFSDYETLRDLILDKTNVDINDYLSEEYLKAHSINSLVQEANVLARFIGEKTLANFIKEDVANLLKENLYDVLNEKLNVSASLLENIQENIVKYVTLCKESGTNLVLKLDEEGNYRSLNFVFNLDDENIVLKGGLSVQFNKDYKSIFDYRALETLCRSVGDIVTKEAFGTTQAIQAYFGNRNVNYVTDEEGNIISVFFVETSNYYPSSSSEEYKRYATYCIETEDDIVDLFNYTQYPFYKDLVQIYKDFHEGNRIYVTYRDNYYRYDFDSFQPANYMFYQVCGNKYNVSYSLPVLRTEYYNAVSVMVYNEANELVYRQILATNEHSYSSTYGGGSGAVDIRTEKFVIGGNSQHSYVLVEKGDEETANCGDTIKVIYNCIDCGAVLDQSYVKQHTEGELVKYELVKEGGTCEDGVRYTYKCAECEQEYEVVERAYDSYRDHKYVKTDLVPCEGGATLRYQYCACGRSIFIDIVDYYADDEIRSYYNVTDGQYIDGVEVYYPNDSESEDLRPIFLYSKNIDSKTNQCAYDQYWVVLEGVQFDQVSESGERGITYEHKTEDLWMTRYNHNWVIETLEYENPENPEAGIVYQSKCARCGELGPVYHYDLGYYFTTPYAFPEGYPYVGENSRIYVYGNGRDRLNGIAEHVDVYAERCQFESNWVYPESGDKSAGYHVIYSCAASEETSEGFKPCEFRYAVFYEQTERVDSCHVAHYNEYRIGCDENGENAKMTFKTDYRVYEEHDWEDLEERVIDTDNQYIKIVEVGQQCKGCDEKHTSYTLRITDELNTEDVTVTKDGLTYVYPAGTYYPNLGFANRYTAYNADRTLVINGYNEIYCDDSYSDGLYYAIRSFENTSGLLVAEDGGSQQFEVSNIYTYEYHYFEKELVRTNVNGQRYYYPYVNGEDFAAVFETVTLFPYSLEKFGCYRITENFSVSGDHSDVRYSLEVRHLSLQGEGKSCTQPVELTCVYCGKSVTSEPHGHNFVWNGEYGCYECQVCHTLAPNDNNGRIILEDLTKVGEENLTVGFYSRNLGAGATLAEFKENGEVWFNVVSTEGYDQWIDVEIEDLYTSGKFSISIAAIKEAMANNGIKDQYVRYVRCNFYDYKEGFETSLIFTPAELGIDTSNPQEQEPTEPDYPYNPDQPETYISFHVKSDSETVMEKYGEANIVLRVTQDKAELAVEAEGFYEVFYLEKEMTKVSGSNNPNNFLVSDETYGLMMYDAELGERFFLVQNSEYEEPDQPDQPDYPEPSEESTIYYSVESEDERALEKYSKYEIVLRIYSGKVELKVDALDFHEEFFFPEGAMEARGSLNPDNRIMMEDENYERIAMFDAEIETLVEFVAKNTAPIEPDPEPSEEQEGKAFFLYERNDQQEIANFEFMGMDQDGREEYAAKIDLYEGQKVCIVGSEIEGFWTPEIDGHSFGGASESDMAYTQYIEKLDEGVWVVKTDFYADAHLYVGLENSSILFLAKK